ncbi:hypothetical protein FORC13_p076 (plasmid) [Bacillus cereus]|nr:hypothetical protein FORC13_p076 [Bacillus cereus]
MYKKLGTFTGALSFSLAACGSNERTSNGVETKEKEQTKQETKKDNLKEEKAESTKDNRTNPIAFNETASIDDVI